MAIYKDGKKAFLLKDDHEVASISKNGTKVCGTKHENGLSPAYEQSVSDKAYPRATLYKVGGKSVKWNQLANLTARDTTQYGITIHRAPGVFNASGTATGAFNHDLQLVNVEKGHVYFLIDGGVQYPTIRGSSYASLQLYQSGIISITITEGGSFNTSYGKATASGGAYLRHRFQTGSTYNIQSSPCLIDLTAIYGAGNEPTGAELTTLKNIAAALPQYDAGSIKHAAVDIVRGDAPLIIPQAVRDLPDYGAGVGDVYNEIDMEPAVYHNMKAVDLGTLNWQIDTAVSHRFRAALAGWNDRGVRKSIGICTGKYAVISDGRSYDATAENIMYGTNGQIYFQTSEYTTAAAFKASVSGVILHYEAISGGSDYTARVYRRRIGSIELNFSSYTKRTDVADVFQANTTLSASLVDYVNFMCYKYTSNPRHSSISIRLKDKEIGLNTSGAVSIRDSAYINSTTAEFRASLAGVYLYYGLVGEQVYDITPYFPVAPVVNVSPGGSVVFENEAKMPVPNKTQYIVNDV